MNTSWIFPVLLLIWDLKVSAEMSLAAHGQDTQPLRDNTVDDDDDFGSESGSGCGGDGKCLRPDLQPTVRAESPGAVEGKQVPKDVTEVPDGRIKGVSTSCTPQMEDPPPKSIFQKREVLAVVIIGGVILFATLITLLLLHHMKKKDEGSYSLTSSAYQRAPSREFYA